jgi:hypothetical protein
MAPVISSHRKYRLPCFETPLSLSLPRVATEKLIDFVWNPLHELGSAIGLQARNTGADIGDQGPPTGPDTRRPWRGSAPPATKSQAHYSPRVSHCFEGIQWIAPVDAVVHKKPSEKRAHSRGYSNPIPFGAFLVGKATISKSAVT